MRVPIVHADSGVETKGVVAPLTPQQPNLPAGGKQVPMSTPTTPTVPQAIPIVPPSDVKLNAEVLQWRVTPVQPMLDVSVGALAPTSESESPSLHRFLQVPIAEGDVALVTYEVTTTRRVGGRANVEALVRFPAGSRGAPKYRFRIAKVTSVDTLTEQNDIYTGPQVVLTPPFTPLVWKNTTTQLPQPTATDVVYSWSIEGAAFEGIPLNCPVHLVLDLQGEGGAHAELRSDVLLLGDVIPPHLRDAPTTIAIGNTRVPYEEVVRVAVPYEGCNYTIDATTHVYGPTTGHDDSPSLEVQDGDVSPRGALQLALGDVLASTVPVEYPLGTYTAPLSVHTDVGTGVPGARVGIVFSPIVSGYVTGITIPTPSTTMGELTVELLEHSTDGERSRVIRLGSLAVKPTVSKVGQRPPAITHIPFEEAIGVEGGSRYSLTYVLPKMHEEQVVKYHALGGVKERLEGPLRLLEMVPSGAGVVGSAPPLDVLFDLGDVFVPPNGGRKPNDGSDSRLYGKPMTSSSGWSSRLLGTPPLSPQVVPRCVGLEMEGVASILEAVQHTWGVTQAFDAPAGKITLAGKKMSTQTLRTLSWSFAGQVEYCAYKKEYKYTIHAERGESDSSVSLSPMEPEAEAESTPRQDDDEIGVQSTIEGDAGSEPSEAVEASISASGLLTVPTPTKVTRELARGTFTISPNQQSVIIKGSTYLRDSDRSLDYRTIIIIIEEPSLEVDVMRGTTKAIPGRAPMVRSITTKTTMEMSDPDPILSYDVIVDGQREDHGAFDIVATKVDGSLDGAIPVLPADASSFEFSVYPKIQPFEEKGIQPPPMDTKVTGILSLACGDQVASSALKYRL